MASDAVPFSLLGCLAYSQKRLDRIAKEVGAKAVSAIYVHYIQPYRRLDRGEHDVLDRILNYGTPASPIDPLSRVLLQNVHGSAYIKDGNILVYHVSPRHGTVSPWSSQATCIAHVCGLEQSIQRIERGIACAVEFGDAQTDKPSTWTKILFDRMTQELWSEAPDLLQLFKHRDRVPARYVSILNSDGASKELLIAANKELGLALDSADIDYLLEVYSERLRRDAIDAELFSWAQVNSEHCRHKLFNADITVDGTRMPRTLFNMIRHTHDERPQYTISAYSDNAAVLEGVLSSHWSPNQLSGEWNQVKEEVPYVIKVETHNHPTAVSPYPGAATGSGGEIRDEGSVGRGSRPKAGLAAFCVSDLLIPDHVQPWELNVGRPDHIASSLEIMRDAPIGSAHYNNEFGRPCLAGFFRTLTVKVKAQGCQEEIRGYHKPIMLAGGIGTVRPQHALKEKGLVKPGAHIVILGGPAMLIGLGGGAASSVQSGEGSADLDFASVQRGNAEVQRRVQEVINTCTAPGRANPIQLIHDVGAGGLSNALPELVHEAGLGATFELREIDNADEAMSPLEIWCCEAQERYVVAIDEGSLHDFIRIAKRERCGYSVVGKTTGGHFAENLLLVLDRDSKDFPKPIDLPMGVLFGKPPRVTKIVDSRKLVLPRFDRILSTYVPTLDNSNFIYEAIDRVLSLPSVGSKSFLITIGDRSVGGLTVRDQMVGPWQTPVADVAVTATSLQPGVHSGEAMAMGEKPILALISPAASARMAVAESLMNLSAAYMLDSLRRVRLSANWMAASNHPGEVAALYEAVEAIAMELCPELGVSIPVGKDSMSMKMKWVEQDTNEEKEVTAPLSLVITAFAPVQDIANTWTPTLRRLEDVGETLLLFVDLAVGRKALGGSALAQCFGQIGNESPDMRDVELFADYFDAIQQLHEADVVLAYHDRSDGGLLATLVEMMFAGRCGLEIFLDNITSSSKSEDIIEALFNEELGAVFQVRKRDEQTFNRCFATCGPPPGLIKRIGRVPSLKKQDLTFWHGLKSDPIYRASRKSLEQRWSSTSHQIQRLRDDPACADAEYANITDDNDPGLSYNLTFNPKDNILPFSFRSTLSAAALISKPRVAILREQGVNGQAEMAFAFHVAGFSAIDVHMTDIISGRLSLAGFVGLAACGGFSYGDVLGAGRGWALSVLLHPAVRKEFQTFFERPETFTLGVCNGCQFLSHMNEIIPGAENWPTFQTNESEQYEARVCMVQVSDTSGNNRHPPSVFLHGMNGSTLPIVTAHAEGKATFSESAVSASSAAAMVESGLVPLRYVDNRLQVTEQYPFNPNGSPLGIAAVRTPDGRCLAMMPHPERTILKDVASYIPQEQAQAWGEFGPWVRMFKSARRWVG